MGALSKRDLNTYQRLHDEDNCFVMLNGTRLSGFADGSYGFMLRLALLQDGVTVVVTMEPKFKRRVA